MSFKLKQAVLDCVFKTATGHNEQILKEIPATLSELTSQGNKLIGVLQFLPHKRHPNNILHCLEENQNILIQEGESKSINFTNVSDCGRRLDFNMNLNHYLKNALNSPISLSTVNSRKKIIVEYSSPNLAKEFHMGHLRSTIMGNFVSNIKEKFGYEVVRMNFIGDWGVQFGLLLTGLDLLGYTIESLHDNTISKLHNAYTTANKEARRNNDIYDKAKKIYKQMEDGDTELLKIWLKVKDYSVKDLSSMYKRLGVEFNVYEWESDYRKNMAEPFLENLREKELLSKDSFGRLVVSVDGDDVPLLKSDGTTLYMLRDIQAFFHRRSSYNIHKIYYVVDSGQTERFRMLSHICSQMDNDVTPILNYVPFGRVLGMSTRKGTGIMLQDVLNEARERMYENQVNTNTTKGEPNLETADHLGKSAVIVYDLGRKRKSDYHFDWHKAINNTGKTGIKLQYCHCRLCSLLKYSGTTLCDEIDINALLEPEAIDLIIVISKFEAVLVETDMLLEPNILIQYLFELVSSTNRAFRKLRVKDTADIGQHRLYLFNSARLILAEGLKILGITPLEEM